MKTVSLRLATLAALSAAALVACGGGQSSSNAPGQGADSAAQAATPVSASITGAGASFVYPLMSRWSADYNKATGSKVNYQSIGSGGGIAQVKAGTVDFGSTDRPLSSQELAEAGLAQFPSAIGGVVPVFNLDGIAPGKLRISGATLAGIYLGNITQWNDARLVAENPDVRLPNEKIHVVRRSDGSGTTFNFSNYLSKISPEWKEKIGEGTSVNFPVGMGGKGNEGVAAYVKQIKGAIGYVELSYALQNQMPYAAMQNAAGNWVQPNAESFSAAAASADWASATDFNLVITNAPGAEAWPMTATNFMLIYRQPKNPEKQAATLDFFRWAFSQGQAQAQSLDYVPLPPELVAQIETYWNALSQ
ncbi:phosphate ABC transporter substrate-binding protein PstS [Lysobacteraceae bacterium NML120232]|nr:phosphate ABC transporter substrate-binding protein PstS [Xanthomonadaceae bacterium NML08-0793]PJK13776.1 phosphate ABC transporter substrate-binding protein PstS [Xanthomonadaceae bacterium NML120232]